MPFLAWAKSRFYQSFLNWKKREHFKIEISLVILVKALFLYGLWFFFFSHGLQDHLNDALMTKHLVGV